MADPIQAGAVDHNAIARIRAAIAETRKSWDRLDTQHRIIRAIATTIETVIPSWLQIGPINQFMASARFFDSQYQRLGTSLAWFEKLPDWIADGAVELRPSTRDPSDYDIVIRSDSVPIPPFAQEVQGLGNLWVAFGVIAGLAGLKITTDFMAEKESTQRKQVDFLMLKMITDARESGTLSEGTAVKLTQLISKWKTAAEPETDTLDQITTVAKWGVGLAIALGALGLIWKIKETWQERD